MLSLNAKSTHHPEMKRDLLLLLAAAVAGCAPRHTITGHIDSLTNDSLCIVHCAIEDMPGLIGISGDKKQRYKKV